MESASMSTKPCAKCIAADHGTNVRVDAVAGRDAGSMNAAHGGLDG